MKSASDPSASCRNEYVFCGTTTDIPVPKDYDGDGRTDLAIWRPSTGEWWLYFLGTNTYRGITHGTSGDVPIR